MSLSSVLVAVNGDETDDETVQLACELLNSRKGSLYILYVIEIERGFPVDAEIAPATARGEEILKHVEAVAKPFKFRTEAELIQSRDIGSAVVQEAVDRAVDTIVLGLPYKQRYGSFEMGDMVPYVLRNAPCRVIVSRDSVALDGSNGPRRFNP